jgi:hypothetical protein
MYTELLAGLNHEDAATSAACQGNIFKASVSTYQTARGFAQTVRFTRSARLSCPGCDQCFWQVDALSEVGQEWPVHGIEAAKDGAFYGLTVCNESRDRETGIVDSWDLQLSPFTPTQHQAT